MEIQRNYKRHVEWTIAVSSINNPEEVVDVLYTEDGAELLLTVPALEELGLNTIVTCNIWYDEIEKSEDN